MKKDRLGNYLAVFLVILAAIISSGVPVFLKISLQQIPTFIFIFLRFLLAAFILMPIFWLKKEKFPKKYLKSLLFVSLLATANVTLFAFGVKKTTAIISQILYAGIPLLVSLFSYYFLKKGFNLRTIAGLLIGFFGVSIIILLPVLGSPSVFKGDLTGNLLIFFATLLYSLYTVFSKKIQKTYSPLSLTTAFILTTIFVQSLPAAIEFQSQPNFFKAVTFPGLLGLFYVSLLGTSFYFFVYQYAIKKSTPTIASLIFYLQPVFSLFWAAAFLGERVTLGFLIGGLLALVGASIVTRNRSN